MDNDLVLSIMENTETSKQELSRYYFCLKTDCAQCFHDCVTKQRDGSCFILDFPSSHVKEEIPK